MKLPIALGIALAALTVAGAAAQSSNRHIIMSRSGSSDANLDANADGWITRAEASAAYERIFHDLDTNNDGKLDDSDHQRQRIHVTGNAPAVHIFRNGDNEDRREVRVVTGDLSAEDEARIEAQVAAAMARAEAQVERSEHDRARAERHAERAERMADEAERRAERIEREVEHAEHDGDRSDREVIIVRTVGENGSSWTSLEGDDVDLVAPVPPIPPVPPVAPFMLLIANSEEADLNGDGALSLEEFRNQHLRFFDASDANGDGRVRFEEPRAPAQPPSPPAPPEPPRRR